MKIKFNREEMMKMAIECRELEIIISKGNFTHTTHDYFGETCEDLHKLIKKFIDERAFQFRFTSDRDDPRGPHRDRHNYNNDNRDVRE